MSCQRMLAFLFLLSVHQWLIVHTGLAQSTCCYDSYIPIVKKNTWYFYWLVKLQIKWHHQKSARQCRECVCCAQCRECVCCAQRHECVLCTVSWVCVLCTASWVCAVHSVVSMCAVHSVICVLCTASCVCCAQCREFVCCAQHHECVCCAQFCVCVCCALCRERRECWAVHSVVSLCAVHSVVSVSCVHCRECVSCAQCVHHVCTFVCLEVMCRCRPVNELLMQSLLWSTHEKHKKNNGNTVLSTILHGRLGWMNRWAVRKTDVEDWEMCRFTFKWRQEGCAVTGNHHAM